MLLHQRVPSTTTSRSRLTATHAQWSLMAGQVRSLINSCFCQSLPASSWPSGLSSTMLLHCSACSYAIAAFASMLFLQAVVHCVPHLSLHHDRIVAPVAQQPRTSMLPSRCEGHGSVHLQYCTQQPGASTNMHACNNGVAALHPANPTLAHTVGQTNNRHDDRVSSGNPVVRTPVKAAVPPTSRTTVAGG